MTKAKIGILSLGCPRNLVDSENILGRLSLKGHSIVDINKADVAIVNTCSFIDDAKRESIDAILELVELKRSGKLKKIIVYGCMPQRYKDELTGELPEVDAFVGRISLNHELKKFSITPGYYAYLKICEGCINSCSFCAIPSIKGRFLSLDEGSILRKVERFSRDKLSELNIIGQDITGYGRDLYGGYKLTDILKKIDKKAEGIRWIRLLYLYPSRVSSELLHLIRDSKKICKYIDLPIQHVNNRILKLMNRNTSKQDILALINKARKIIPGVGLRSSVIVGFPSETDKEFKELLTFIKEARFERLGAFIYSREEGTPAYNLKGQIPHKAKADRFAQVMSLQQEVSEEVNEGFLGRAVEVLVDEKQNDYYIGRTQYDAPEVDGQVFIRSKKKLNPGDFIKVNITDTMEYDLAGEVQ